MEGELVGALWWTNYVIEILDSLRRAVSLTGIYVQQVLITYPSPCVRTHRHICDKLPDNIVFEIFLLSCETLFLTETECSGGT